jgi:hypothetical protein
MTMQNKVYEKNYQQLMELLGPDNHRRLEVEGFRPLSVEKLPGMPIVSLCKYDEHNGELLRDPEVCFRISGKEAKPVYYRNDYLGREHATEPNLFGEARVWPGIQPQLDRFVTAWLSNLQEQVYFKKAQELNERVAQKADERASSASHPFRSTHAPTDGSALQRAIRDQFLVVIESGNYRAAIFGLQNPKTDAWTYMAALLYRDQELLCDYPLLKEELAQVTKVARARGVDWLSAFQAPLGLPRANNEQLDDFLGVLKVSEALVGQCAAYGHVRALGSKNLAQLGVEPQTPGSVTRTIERIH